MGPSFTLRYLGTAGWHLQYGAASLLIDPYFSRHALVKLLARVLEPDLSLVETHTPPTDWILVTHPHYDHILDVPEVARITGAPVYASRQGGELARILGVPATQTNTIAPGEPFSLGPFRVEVFLSQHRLIFGRVPAFGPLRPNLRPPLRASDYRIEQLYSFRITAGDTRLLITGGIDAEPAIAAEVLLVGADASAEQLTRIIEPAQPQLVMPNHWDDMFQPLHRPVRPSIKPPRSRFSIPRRIDLDLWADRVHSLAPGVPVIIPEHFATYDLTQMVSVV